MHRLTLHIGMPKTGSTAIQQYLMAHHKERCRPKPFGAKGLAWLLEDGPLKQRMIARRRGSNQSASAVKAGLAEIAPRDPILSWEDLFDCSDPQQTACLARHLFDIFERIRVVVYLRHPREHFPSWISQRVRAGETDRERLLQIPPTFYRYAEKCRAWNRHFELVVRDYGRAAPDVVQDFCDRLSLAPSPERAPYVNRSLGEKGVRAGLAINAAVPTAHPAERRAALEATAAKLRKDKAILLPDQIVEQLDCLAREDAAALRNFLPEPLKFRSTR